jgi:hypothetical protein
LRTLPRRLKLSVHRDIIDKHVAESRPYVRGWENVEITAEELAASIKAGHPYCAQVAGYRDGKHFLASDIVSLDIEDSLSIPEALNKPNVSAHATMIYTPKPGISRSGS